MFYLILPYKICCGLPGGNSNKVPTTTLLSRFAKSSLLTIITSCCDRNSQDQCYTFLLPSEEVLYHSCHVVVLSQLLHICNTQNCDTVNANPALLNKLNLTHPLGTINQSDYMIQVLQ